jgi:hypothetical protein
MLLMHLFQPIHSSWFPYYITIDKLTVSIKSAVSNRTRACFHYIFWRSLFVCMDKSGALELYLWTVDIIFYKARINNNKSGKIRMGLFRKLCETSTVLFSIIHPASFISHLYSCENQMLIRSRARVSLDRCTKL